MTPQAADADALRRAFEAELARPEYTVVDDSVLTQVLRWVWDAVGTFFDWLFPGDVEVGPGTWAAWMLLGVAIVVAIVLLRGAWRRRRGPTPSSTALQAVVPRTADGWEKWAEAEMLEGRFRAATTGYYQAALLRLDARGVVRYSEWKTPGDYAEEIDRTSEVGRAFIAFVSQFVSTAFGTVPAGREAVENLARQGRALAARP